MAEAAKERGNERLRAGDVDGALEEYSKAIELDASNHIYYSNRSAANLKLECYAAALADANRCIELAPRWAKGYLRAAAAYTGMGNAEQAAAARQKAQDLGGVPASAAPAGGAAARQPAAAASTSSAPPSARASLPADLMSRMLLALRGFFVLNVLLYIVPGLGGSGSFQTALLAVFGCYMLELFQLHGRPEQSQAYAQRLIMDWRSQYAMTALLFSFVGNSRLVVLAPHFLAEVGHVAHAVMLYAPSTAARLAPVVNGTIAPRFVGVPAAEWAGMSQIRRWELFNARTITVNAAMEVGIGITLIAEMLTPQRSFIVLFAYWHFMRVRYMVSHEIKAVFHKLDSQLLSLTGRVPPLLAVYQRIRGFASSLVQPPTPAAPGAGGAARGPMASLRQNCVIS